MDNRIELIQADITTLNVDVIVNAANSSLMGGGGVDGAIHRAAGPELKEKCRSLRGCKTGQSKITKGFELLSKHIIHTVGPVWYGGHKNEVELLTSCYKTSLSICEEHGLKTIAFPSISTGAYKFPFEMAAQIALKSINEFLSESSSIEKVMVVTYSEKHFKGYQREIQKKNTNNEN